MYRPLWYLLGEYTVHQGKVNLIHMISMSYGSRVSVFTMEGVTIEGTDYFDSLR